MPANPSRFTLFGLAAFGAAIFISHAASAQSVPLLGLSAGSATIADSGVALPGFYVEADRQLTSHLSVVGQAHRATGSGDGYFSTIGWTDLFVGGGLRVSGRPSKFVEPYGQMLVGSYRVTTAEVARPSRFGVGISQTYTDQYMAVVAGGGVTVMATPRVGLRAGADLQFVPDALPTARLVLGAVVRVGRR